MMRPRLSLCFTCLLVLEAGISGQENTGAGSTRRNRVRDLEEVARTATALVDGDLCRRIMTERASQRIFRDDPKDRWAASDDFDVNHEPYIQTKKTLMRLSRLLPYPCDANLWMPFESEPGKVQILIRNVNELSQFWPWGALYQDMIPEMRQVLDTGRRQVVMREPGMISVLAPVYDSLGHRVAVVEVTAREQDDPADSVSGRMRDLLGLSPFNEPLDAETTGERAEADVTIQGVRFRGEGEIRVDATVVRPRNHSGRLGAIICLPGTTGTREQLTDSRLQFAERPYTGWARALARRGFLTVSLDYRGSRARGQNIFPEAVRAHLEGSSYMGVMVREVMRTIDYLETRADVDSGRIGVTGFSLGGAMAWFAAASDPRLSVVVPVCGGAGAYADLLKYDRKINYHSQYFYPAAFLKVFPGDQPEVFAGMAPRALLVVGRDQDEGMAIEGLRRLEAAVGAAYARAGAAERFSVYVTPGNHTYTEDMFERVADWFGRFLSR